MANSVFDIFGSMLKLQRWNVNPRVVIWTEAENIAFTTHLAYGLGRVKKIDKIDLELIVIRTMLKSLDKHILSDISIDTKEEIPKNIWEKLVNETASKTAKFFPKDIYSTVKGFMRYNGDYGYLDRNHYGILNDKNKELIEEIITFSQYQVAIMECKENDKFFPNEYKLIIEKIEEKIELLDNKDVLTSIFNDESLKRYIKRVRSLKFLRRWNQLNRNLETNVLGHTFVVASIALMVILIDLVKLKQNIIYPVLQTVLRALFHDLPEAFTGDIITPVKDLINKFSKGDEDIIKNIEEKMVNRFKNKLPRKILWDINNYDLLKELDYTELYTVSSLVKSCDMLGVVLECILELQSGSKNPQMAAAFESTISTLQNCEWPTVRNLCTHILFEYPIVSSSYKN